jgi:hypothetical protein
MHAMLRVYRMGTGSVEDLMRKVDTGFADRLQRELGIVDYQAIDAGDGIVITTTFFADEERCRQSQAAADRVRVALSEFEVEQVHSWTGPVRINRSSDEALQPIHP